MSHENLLLHPWEEMERESPGDLAANEDLDHVSQRRQQDRRGREVQDEDLASDAEESSGVDKYQASQAAPDGRVPRLSSPTLEPGQKMARGPRQA